MATTQKGIYYPDDYTAIADVPEDMKDLAESVDTALDTKVDKEEGKGLSTYNFGVVQKGRLDSLWQGKATVDSDIARIKATFPTTTGSGENVTLDKTAELDFIQPPLPRGNSEQADISYIDVGTWEQGLIDPTSGQEVTGTVNIRTADYISVFPNILYNISRSIYSSYNSYRFYDKNKNYLGNQTISGMITTNTSEGRMARGISSMTMTILNSNVAYMRITDNSNDLSTVYTISTASPNPSYPQPITNVTGDVEVVVQNKNLWNTVFINSTSAKIRDNERLLVKPNLTYFFNAKTNTSNILNGYFIQYDENLNNIGETNWSTLPISITTKSNCKYLRISLKYSSGANISPSEINNIQLEQGSTATTYTPHREQTFTFPLGNQRMYLGDYLADDGIHHVRGQVTLDGSESGWQKLTTSANNYRFQLYINGLSKTNGSGTIPAILSNYFKAISPNGSFLGRTGISSDHINNNFLYVTNVDEEFDTLEKFKTWLSTHNTIVEYDLVTEEITPYTTEQQQAYNEIKQAISYEEQTNISGSSDESNPLFSVETYQSIKLILAS